MLGIEFKYQEEDLNHMLKLNKAKENLLVTFTRFTKAVQIGITDPEAR